MIKSLNHITDRLYEVELLEPEIEQREPIIVGFLFNKMLNKERLNSITFSSKNFVTLTSMENMKWTFTLSTRVGRQKFARVNLSKRREQRKAMHLRGCADKLTANATDNFFRRICFNTEKKFDKREQGLFKEEIEIYRNVVFLQ